MRVLIMPDADMVVRERELLGRLELGLADEGVRVVQAIPRSLQDHEAAASLAQSVFAKPFPYDDRGLPFTTGLRAMVMTRELLLALRDEPGGEGVDVVYALGERTWPMARKVAKGLDAVFLAEVSSVRQVPRASALWRGASRGADESELKPYFVAASEPIETMLRASVPAARTFVARWGIHASEHSRSGPETGPTVVMLAAKGHPGAVLDAMGAVASLARDYPDLRLLIDSEVVAGGPVWRRAASLGIRDRLSVIAELEGRHDLVTQADLLLIPEPLGEHRSLVLQAMADGMLVVATPDPAIEWLVQGETAILVERHEMPGLAGVLRGILADPDRAAKLRASASAYVRLHWPGSGHVRSVLAACDAVVAQRDSSPARRL